MGAEHSIVKHIGHAKGQKGCYKVTSRRKSNEPVQSQCFDDDIDLDDFFREKQQQFNQLMDDNASLTLEKIALELASVSIQEATAQVIQQLEEKCLDSAAKSIAWEAISKASLEILADIPQATTK